MRLLTAPALLAAALFSCVTVLPFLPAAKNKANFALEARIAASASGRLQVYFDDGSGLREEASSQAPLAASETPLTYRLPLPRGTYHALRLDPIDREGSVVIESLQIVQQDGATLRHFAWSELQPATQIQSSEVRDGRLHVVTTPNAHDPQLAIRLTPPLILDQTWGDLLGELWLPASGVLAGVIVVLFVLDLLNRRRNILPRSVAWLTHKPARSVSVVAAMSVVASCYPIVFLGKSFVSPNMGTALLYDHYPTLPGYTNPETTDANGSDIGAIMWQHVPYSMLQRRALSQGELPLWNRYNSSGLPLLGQGQSMFGDPLHWLVIAANGQAWAWDFKYAAAKWLFALGLGLTVLNVTRHLGAALLVSAAAPFIGFFLYRLNHPAFFSLCYAPWPLYCFVRIAHATSRRSIALWCLGLFMANLALMNSGTVKEAYLLLLCMNLSGGCVLLAADANWRPRIVKLAAVCWTGVLFVLVTMPLWETFLDTLRRAYTSYNAVSAYQIQPSLLLGAFDEIFYRPLMPNQRTFSPSMNFLLLGGLLYFLATLRTQTANKIIMAVAASSLPPLALAFGLVSPQWIVRLPFLGNVAHLDNTFSCALIVLWSVLAGAGFATAAIRLGEREGRGDLAICALLLFGLVFGWVAFRQVAHRPIFGPTFTVNAPGSVLAVSDFIWDYLAALLLALVVFALLARRALVRPPVASAQALLLATCVSVLLWRHGLHASHVGFEEFTARPAQRVDFHARSPALEEVRARLASEPGRVCGIRNNLFPGWSGVYGIEGINSPDALMSPYYRELSAHFAGIERIWDWRLYLSPEHVTAARPFLDALNARFYVDLESDQGLLGQALELRRTSDLDVYESPTTWPRAFFTDRILLYDQPAELTERIRDANGRPFAAAQRSDATMTPALAQLPQDLASRVVTPAANYRLTENTTTFTVQASGPGAVVLAETFWPDGFRAEVNGRETAVVRLNHAFKGVLVDAAGEYRVTFRYWPKNLTRNLTFSAMGTLLLLFSMIVAFRRPRAS